MRDRPVISSPFGKHILTLAVLVAMVQLATAQSSTQQSSTAGNPEVRPSQAQRTNSSSTGKDPAWNSEPSRATPVENPFTGNFLLGDWGGLRTKWAEKGFNFDIHFTQFVQAITDDTSDSFDHYANRWDAYLNIDTEKAGWWKGGSIGTHWQIRFGSAPTAIAVFPANAGLITPLTDVGKGAVTSLFVTQRLGKKSSIMFGKIDGLDLLANAPFMGGRGVDGFMHAAFAGPPSGVAPPSTYGAIYSTRFRKR